MVQSPVLPPHRSSAKAQAVQQRSACVERSGWGSFYACKAGDSPVLNRMRDEIETQHPQITLLDTPHFLDSNVFNDCEQMGCAMDTLEIWQDVHPSLDTVPMAWDTKMPYGIVFSKLSELRHSAWGVCPRRCLALSYLSVQPLSYPHSRVSPVS